MKKLLWLVGALFVVLIVAVVSIPLFVDVDQYRPAIVAEANKKLNGKLELGKLKLSLWGAVKIHAESIRLTVDGFPEPMLDTKQFYLEVPFLSLITMRPLVIAVLDQPKISVVKDLNGMNVLRLMKAAKTEAPSGTSAEAEDTGRIGSVASAEPAKVPVLLAGASLGLRIKEGDVHYQDKVTKADYRVDGLDLDAKNLGLGSEMSLKLKAPLKGGTPTMSFSGSVSAAAEIKPVLAGGNLRGASGSIDLDASKLAVEVKGGNFKKPEGMTLVMRAEFDGDEKETLLKSAVVQIHEVKLHGKGRVTLQPVTAKLEVSADPIRLDRVGDFVPMLGAYQPKGVLEFNVKVDQDPAALKLNGDLKLSDGAVHKKDLLREPLKLQLQAGFSENSLNIVRATVIGPDSDLQLQGNVRNFLAPQFALTLTGKSFNVDKTLILPEGEKEAARFAVIAAAVAAPAKKDTLNPMSAMATNPMLARAAGTFSAQVGKVTVKQAELENVNLKAQFQNLALKVQDASFRTFGGTVRANGDFDLKSPGLAFKTQGNVAGISAKDAFTKYFPKYQNTLEGKVNANWNVSGAAYPESQRLRSLRGGAKLSATDGALKSVDFQSSINTAMQKIPFLKDKKPISVDNGFKSLVAELKFDNGTIKVEPIESQPRGKGFIVKGKATIQESLEHESFFDVYDPSGQLPEELQQPGKPALVLRLHGPVTAPKTDYEYTVKKLASTAGKSALKEALGKALGGSKDGDKKDAVKDLGEKLKKKFKLF